VNRPVSDLYAEVIRVLNTLSKPILAVDIPSGIAADHGNIIGEHIRATYTVTFALPKHGLIFYPAAAAAGDLHIGNIGIPAQAIEAENVSAVLLDTEEIRRILPVRSPNSHKGSYGHLLVVAGSPGKSGAGSLASQAALRSGVGLATFALPKGLNTAMEAVVTEVMTLPVAENEVGRLCAAALPQLSSFLTQVDALVLGPGLGTHPDTVHCVHTLLQQVTVPIVLDADGLNSLVGNLHVLQDCQAPVLLTPHPGEMARLLTTNSADVQSRRLEAARELAQQYSVYVVLKGARTVIAAPSGQCWVNPTGNAAMATAGTGDVLSGMIGAFLCQGLTPLSAAQCAVYLHGLAGDRLCQRLGTSGLLASDLIAELPYTLHAVREGLVCTP
jgi:NAD(P)H-hydrate epimerase